MMAQWPLHGKHLHAVPSLRRSPHIGNNALGAWPSTWCASSQATIDSGGTEWIQIDFGAPTVATVEAVELQGKCPGGCILGQCP